MRTSNKKHTSEVFIYIHTVRDEQIYLEIFMDNKVVSRVFQVKKGKVPYKIFHYYLFVFTIV